MGPTAIAAANGAGRAKVISRKFPAVAGAFNMRFAPLRTAEPIWARKARQKLAMLVGLNSCVTMR